MNKEVNLKSTTKYTKKHFARNNHIPTLMHAMSIKVDFNICRYRCVLCTLYSYTMHNLNGKTVEL